MGTEDFRQELLARVQARRPLILPWLEPTTVLSLARGLVRLGFPSSESHAKDSLARENQRSFLESTAAEILGVTVKFDLVVDPSLKPPPATGLFDEPLFFSPPPRTETAPATPPSKPEEPAPPTPAEPAAAPAAESEPTEAVAGAPMDEFHNDPLIQSAVEKFKLKLASR